MNELLELLKSKVGLGDDQASGAIQTVVDFLQDKLPGPVADQIKGLLAGEGGGLGDLGDIADKAKDALGGILGGQD